MHHFQCIIFNACNLPQPISPPLPQGLNARAYAHTVCRCHRVQCIHPCQCAVSTNSRVGTVPSHWQGHLHVVTVQPSPKTGYDCIMLMLATYYHPSHPPLKGSMQGPMTTQFAVCSAYALASVQGPNPTGVLRAQWEAGSAASFCQRSKRWVK